jgi:transcriptional regulator with XRE-family HTH domain
MLLRSGEALKEAIVAAGLRQVDVARSANVHHSFVSNLISGRERTCSPTTAARIAEVVRKPLPDLFDAKGASRVRRCDSCGQPVVQAGSAA